jgi:CHAT domain-containing protein
LVVVGQLNPLLRCGLVLANSDSALNGLYPDTGREDGLLTAFEIAQMDLSQTKLIVLSACQTGQGDIAGTEGVMGLPRAFAMAGIGHFLVSLTDVLDTNSTQLMAAFYNNWLAGQPVADALYGAQMDMRKKHPAFVWAQFVALQ